MVAFVPDEVATYVHAAAAPLAVITAGTAVDAPPAWVARCTEAVLAQGLRVLVPGRHASHASSAAEGRWMTAPPSPLGAIRPKTSLLVHHGGIGTSAGAPRAGVPLWLVPSAHDQADNAQRLVDPGVGRRSDVATKPAVLSDAVMAQAWPALHARAQALKARLAAEPDGMDRLADWVMTDAEPQARDRATAPRLAPGSGPRSAPWPTTTQTEAS